MRDFLYRALRLESFLASNSGQLAPCESMCVDPPQAKSLTRDPGCTMDSETSLRSAGSLLYQVRAPIPAP
ncbi:hypothetical protein PoB_004681300 [Plakobranchus ocellatus]|uniref:Uncharacterized protein n=1 Tax=Plakobranchus ocellatus TaxID=259542 RepID=A0AAV4BNE8_9GAST|nr:hypothetical protein PoB_004681300 [Plakobranchus ocellatus]